MTQKGLVIGLAMPGIRVSEALFSDLFRSADLDGSSRGLSLSELQAALANAVPGGAR